jgi:N4-gp56 family major capsid protein
MATITSASLTAAIDSYYERRLLTQPEISNDLLKYGLKAMIPKGNSNTIFWTRVEHFGRAQSVTDGTDLSTERTPTISSVQGTLALFGDFVKITPYGDEIRIFSMIDKSYDEFILQASREANIRLQTTMAAGDSTTGNSFPAPTEMWAGNASGFNELAGGGNYKLAVKDLERAIFRIKKSGSAGKIRIITNQWGLEDLMLDDKFRNLVATQSLNTLKDGELTLWGGASIGINNDPWREDLSTAGGVKGTYSATGQVFTTWVFAEEAFGTVQLMGRGGLRPRFKTQDVSVIGNLVTVAYFMPYKGGNLNASLVCALRHVNDNDTVAISTFTT